VFVDSCLSAVALSVSFLITILVSGDDNAIDVFLCVVLTDLNEIHQRRNEDSSRQDPEQNFNHQNFKLGLLKTSVLRTTLLKLRGRGRVR